MHTRESRLHNELEQVAVFGDNKYVLFGDQAYGLVELLLAPFRGRNVLAHQRQFNQSMKEIRLAVDGALLLLLRIYC